MKVSASKAAKMAGVSVPTITRRIDSNDLSAEKKPKGGYLIEVSELQRVFPDAKLKPNDTPTTLQTETPNNDNALQVEVELLRERLKDKDSTIEDLRTRLDREGEERRQLTAVLTDQRSQKKSFWARLTGQGN